MRWCEIQNGFLTAGEAGKISMNYFRYNSQYCLIIFICFNYLLDYTVTTGLVNIF